MKHREPQNSVPLSGAEKPAPEKKSRRIWLIAVCAVLVIAVSLFAAFGPLLPGRSSEETVTVYCLTGIRYVNDGVESEHYPKLVYDKNGNLLKLDYDYAFWEYTYDDRGNVLTGTTNQFNQANVVFTYDDQNRRITKLEYGQDGVFSKGYRYTYNSQGQKTANIQIEEDGTETGWKETFSYDAAGRLLSWQILVEEDVRMDTGWVYDGSGNLLEEWQQIMGPATHYLYTYDSSNRLLLRRTEKSGTELERYEYRYSDDGTSVLELQYKQAQDTPFRRTYTLDQNGSILQKAFLNGRDEPIQKETWTYDKNGRLLSHYQMDTYSSDEYTDWTYDEAGRLLTAHIKHSGSLGLIHQSRAYRYDKSGNLVWSSPDADSTSGTKYIYTACSVPRANAENVQRQQQELLDGVLLTAEYAPVIPVLIEPSVAGPRQEAFLLNMWQGLSV